MLKIAQNQGGGKADSQTAQQRYGSRDIIIDGVIDASVRDFAKGFVTSASQLGSSSRVSAGRFAWAKQRITLKPHALNFVLMNGSSMVSTRSRSGEGMNLLTSNHDAHGVLDINIFDISPTHGHGLEGIMNRDSFIKDDNSGMNEEPVTSQNNCYSPSNRCNDVLAVGIEDGLNDQQDRSNDGSTGKEVTALGPEDFNIRHAEIFSRKVAS